MKSFKTSLKVCPQIHISLRSPMGCACTCLVQSIFLRNRKICSVKYNLSASKCTILVSVPSIDKWRGWSISLANHCIFPSSKTWTVHLWNTCSIFTSILFRNTAGFDNEFEYTTVLYTIFRHEQLRPSWKKTFYRNEKWQTVVFGLWLGLPLLKRQNHKNVKLSQSWLKGGEFMVK